MPLQLGQPAPEFSLFDDEKNKVNLADQRGSNVLLLFFPLAFTSVCTAELCSVRDDISRFNNADARVFGISVDSLYTLHRFREDQQLNFPLLSDFNKEVSRLYDSLYPVFGFEMREVSKRSAFLIDREGNLAYQEILENAGLVPDFEAIHRELEKLR